MIKFKKAVSAGVLSLGVVVGLASFAGATSGTIGTTGPHSENKITHESRTELGVENDNDIKLSNDNSQYASSGDTRVHGNTTGGHGMSGDGANDNSVDAMIEVDNSHSAAVLEGIGSGSASGSASIQNTGPSSENHRSVSEGKD